MSAYSPERHHGVRDSTAKVAGKLPALVQWKDRNTIDLYGNFEMSQKRYDLIKVEKYSAKGTKHSRSYTVGKAIKMRGDGYMLFVPEGLSVSGQLLMVPERTSINEIDLIEAYESAADEIGV